MGGIAILLLGVCEAAARAYKKFVAASVGVTPFSTRVPFDMAIETADRVYALLPTLKANGTGQRVLAEAYPGAAPGVERIEEAGADALELNIYYIPGDPHITGREVEQRHRDPLLRLDEEEAGDGEHQRLGGELGRAALLARLGDRGAIERGGRVQPRHPAADARLHGRDARRDRPPAGSTRLEL